VKRRKYLLNVISRPWRNSTTRKCEWVLEETNGS